MTGKTKGKTVRVTSSSRAKGRVFEIPSVQETYVNEIVGRGILAETTISTGTHSILTIPEIIDPLNHNKWDEFCNEIDPVFSKTLVWEFYAHAKYRKTKDPKSKVSWVRGKEIPYDKPTIAKVLGIECYPPSTDFTIFEKNDVAQPKSYAAMRDLLFVKGKDWSYDEYNEVKFVYAKFLKPFARFWAIFVMHNLVPQSHKTEVKPDIIRIVYGIVRGMTVDAALIISSGLRDMAEANSKGYLGYPYVIHRLCAYFGVSFEDDLMDLRRTPMLTMRHYERYNKIAYHETLVPAIAPAAPVIQEKAPKANSYDEVLQVVKKINKRQQKYKEIAHREIRRTKARDECLKNLCIHFGLPYLVPPYTEEDMLLLDSSEDEGKESEGENEVSMNGEGGWFVE